jgi:hypothetical protein
MRSKSPRAGVGHLDRLGVAVHIEDVHAVAVAGMVPRSRSGYLRADRRQQLAQAAKQQDSQTEAHEAPMPRTANHHLPVQIQVIVGISTQAITKSEIAKSPAEFDSFSSIKGPPNGWCSQDVFAVAPPIVPRNQTPRTTTPTAVRTRGLPVRG